MLESRLTLLLSLLSAGGALAAPPPREAGSKPAAKQPAAPALTPREALARESLGSLARTPVDAAEAPFRGTVLSGGVLAMQKHPSALLVTVPLGGNQRPITCFFYPTPIDAGVSARTVLQSLMTGVTLENVRATDVKAFGGSPALYLEGDFTRNGQVGRIKLMVHADPALPKTCFHDELGYEQTFARVTESLATGLKSTAAQQPVPPYFSDVQVMRVDKQVLGFQYTTYFRSKVGGSIVETSTTLVRPGAPSDSQIQDTNLQEQADEAGVLVKKGYNKRINTTDAEGVRLRREQDGSYSVQGKLGGKDVTGHLTGELVGEVGLATRLREGLLKDGKPVELSMWVPNDNPTAPTKVVASPRAGAGARAVTLRSGAVNLKVDLDANGFVERLEVPAGGATLVQERVGKTEAP
jgi:hypothetical protein